MPKMATVSTGNTKKIDRFMMVSDTNGAASRRGGHGKPTPAECVNEAMSRRVYIADS
jgi:hypothetical protein